MIDYFLKNPSDSIGLIGSILTVLLSGYISNKVSKKNIKNEQVKIDRQIKSEIDKLELQYKYSQKLNNSDFLYRFKLEKLAVLYELVGQFGRHDAEVSLKIESLLRKNKIEDITENQKNDFIMMRTKLEEDFFEKNVMRKITINMSYFPSIKEHWLYASSLKFKVIDMYPDQILGLLTIKDSAYFDNKIPDDYTLKQYIDDIRRVRLEIQSVLEEIENEIGRIMIEMERL
ncbi:hypothetical protein [Enterococcus mundtii]|uniref:hypothetical protein n=1 Tax=Enterococcus mundtii TaxID=53346 RepID=UPI001F45C576|nr:hypothetical protein [Enterococcus mundtii]